MGGSPASAMARELVDDMVTGVLREEDGRLCGWEVPVLLTVAGEKKILFTPGDTNVEKPSLILKAGGVPVSIEEALRDKPDCPVRPVRGELAGVQPGDEDDRELEALCLVEGGDCHRIRENLLTGPALLSPFHRMLLDVLQETVDLHRRDQGIQVLKRSDELRELAEVVVPGLREKSPVTAHGLHHPVKKRLQAERLTHVSLPLQLRHRIQEQCTVGLPPAERPIDLFEQGKVHRHRAFEGVGVPPEKGEGLHYDHDLGSVKEPAPTDHEGNSSLLQGGEERAGIHPDRAHQHRHVTIGERPLFSQVIDVLPAPECPDLPDNPCHLPLFICEETGGDVALLGLPLPFRPGLHRLGQPKLVPIDHPGCGADDPRGRSEVLLDTDGRDVRVPGAKRDDIFIVRAPPVVDALVVITDDGEVPGAADHQAYQLLLESVDVLVLVDDQVTEPFSLTVEQGGVLFERFDILGYHPGEVDVMICMETVEIGAVTLAERRVKAGRVYPLVPDQIGVPAEVVDDLIPRRFAAPVLVMDKEVLETEVTVITGTEERPHIVVEQVEGPVHRQDLLQPLITVGMDGADREAGQVRLRRDQVMQVEAETDGHLFCGPVCKGEGNDRSRVHAPDDETGDAPGDRLGLARAGTGDHLQVSVAKRDRPILLGGQHGSILISGKDKRCGPGTRGGAEPRPPAQRPRPRRSGPTVPGRAGRSQRMHHRTGRSAPGRRR